MSNNATPVTDGIPVTGWLHVEKIWTLGNYGHKVMVESFPDVAVKFEPMVRQAAVVDLELAMRKMLLAFDNSENSDPDRSPAAAEALAQAKQAMGLDPEAPMPRRAKGMTP